MLRKFFRKREKTEAIDAQIARVLNAMDDVEPSSDEFPKLTKHLEQLYEIKDKEVHDPVSRDTIALVVGNLLGILFIVAYEQKHVMTSKGFSQIIQPTKRPK